MTSGRVVRAEQAPLSCERAEQAPPRCERERDDLEAADEPKADRWSRAARSKSTRRQVASVGAGPPVRPAFVSQHTAPAVLGFKNARAFLDWLPKSGLRVVERGKDRLVVHDDAVSALAGDRPDEPVNVPSRLSGAATQPETSDEVLAALGRRTERGAAGQRRRDHEEEQPAIEVLSKPERLLWEDAPPPASARKRDGEPRRFAKAAS